VAESLTTASQQSMHAAPASQPTTKLIVKMPKFSENIHLMGDFGVATVGTPEKEREAEAPSLNTPKTTVGSLF